MRQFTLDKAVYEKHNLFQARLYKYNLFKNWTTQFNDSSILITIISWDYVNLSLANEYVGHVTISTQVIKYNRCCSKLISQSDCSIHIKLNYYVLCMSKNIVVVFHCLNTECVIFILYYIWKDRNSNIRASMVVIVW